MSQPADGQSSQFVGRILIAEDEPLIAAFLEKGLRANGFATAVSGNGEDALALADSGDFDLLVLDVGLPDRDGLSVLAELRARGRRLPVVMLTARSTVEDAVAGLEGGADDYVGKPFHFDELLARIRVRLREEPAREPTVLHAGKASLDLRSRQLTVGSRTVELTARECALVEVFFRHPGEVLGREELAARVWGSDVDLESNVVEVYVRYLRQKLGADCITTVRLVGYRWDVNGDQPSDPTPTDPAE